MRDEPAHGDPNMKMLLAAAVSSLLPMLALDALWLTTMSKRFYAPRIGHLMSESPALAPAAAFYLVYAVGLAAFVVAPAAREGGELSKTFLRGALFGLVCYATYDLTNQATLKAWPLSLTLVDMAWGAALTGTVSAIACAVVRRWAE
jgi:uncharacterized membrane protein